MTIFPTSIRAKLTLTAVAVMGVLFFALGLVLDAAGRQQVMAGVDSELEKRATEIIQAHKHFEEDRPPGPPQGEGTDFGHRREFGPGDRGPGSGGPGAGPGPGPGRGGFRAAIQQIGDRFLTIGPRFVDLREGPPLPPEMREPYDKAAANLAKKTGTVYSTVLLENEKVRIITKRALDHDGNIWLVQYPYPLGNIDRALASLNAALLILLPIGLLLTGVACLFLIKRVMRPIREIAATAESIRAEDLTRRLPAQGSDEFAQLAVTMNGMLGRLDQSFTAQRIAMERLEAVLQQQRRFTADASHELKTPLAVVKANTGLMLHTMDLPAEQREPVEAIDGAATRMTKLVQGLMVLARAESERSIREAKPFDLGIAVQNAIDQVYRSSVKSIHFEGDPEPLVMLGNEDDFERVFINLVDNACRHTPSTGSINVRATRQDAFGVISVSDNGEGIASEHLQHIFDRFYRADSARSTHTGGTGLGLAICKSIVEGAGGTIEIQSEVGAGTTVTVRVPLEVD